MKQFDQIQYFCLKCIIFTFAIVASSYICDAAFLHNIKCYLPYFQGSEIYNAIRKSKKKVTAKKLILGDSTTNQLFNNKNDEDGFYSLACNQGIGICGQYFLLHNFLMAGNRPNEVYLICNPFSFNNNLDQIYTFHYFLKPFYTDEYKPLMTKTVLNQIKKIPYYKLSQLPLISGVSWAPNYYPPKIENRILSPISVEYLEKIDSLKNEYGFHLYLVPSFVTQKEENHIKNCHIQPLYGRLGKYFDLYMKNIHYLPNDCFADDLHFTPYSIFIYKEKMLNNMNEIKAVLDSIC